MSCHGQPSGDTWEESNLRGASSPAPADSSTPGAPAGRPHPPGVISRQVASLEMEAVRLKEAERALQESNDALRLLSETANELLSSDQPQEVIRALFDKLSARLGLEAYFNYLVDEQSGKLHLNSYAGIPPEVARTIEWLEYGQAVCGCVARDGCRIVAEDISHSHDVRTDLVRSFGITAYACHPLMAQGKVIGTFSFGTSRKPRFDPHELALMQSVCDQVSLAMERILLVRDLSRKEAAQRLLAGASALLTSSLSGGGTLSDLAQLLASQLGDWCVIDISSGAETTRYAAVADTSSDGTALQAELDALSLLAPDEVGTLRWVLATGASQLIRKLDEITGHGLSATRRQKQRLSSLGVRSLLIVPVSDHTNTIGAITLVRAGAGDTCFSEDDLALAQEIGHRAAISLENARLYQEARQAIEARDHFLSAAAHELKTPITNLRGFSQMMARQIDKEKAIDQVRLGRSLEVIDHQSDRLAQLVAQLLDISLIEAGELVLDPSHLEVGALVQGVLDEIRKSNPRFNLTFRSHEPIWARADRARLEQVVRELVQNAIKYSPEGSTIEVDLFSPNIGTAKITVRDRGAGIPIEHRSQIFDRYFQAHSASHTSGLGLSLNVSRHIVELHDGSLELEFPEEGGTLATIILPTLLGQAKRKYSREEERRPAYEGAGS